MSGVDASRKELLNKSLDERGQARYNGDEARCRPRWAGAERIEPYDRLDRQTDWVWVDGTEVEHTRTRRAHLRGEGTQSRAECATRGGAVEKTR